VSEPGPTGAGERPDPPEAAAARAAPRRPLYPRLLGLKNVRPSGWQRALLGEGALALAVVLVLADLASAWSLVVLPLGVAAVVKAHDVLAGLLAALRPAGPANDDGAAPRPAGPGNDDGAAPRREAAPGVEAERG
jgi:hypothetical protein